MKPYRARQSILLTVVAAMLAAAIPVGGAAGDGTPRRDAAFLAQDEDRVSRREARLGSRVRISGPGLRNTRRQIAPGLVFVKMVDRRTPRRIFVLRADLDFPLTFDVSLAGDELPASLRTSGIAERAGAIAAVNGDFTQPGAARPVHAMMQDGTFVQTSRSTGAAFAVSANERRVLVGPPRQLVTATDGSTGSTWVVDRWNEGPPGIGEVVGFSPVGGTLETPPKAACSVHLEPQGPVAFASGGPGVERTFVTDQAICATTPMAVGDGAVLSAFPGTDEATQLMAMPLGTTITITWSLGWQEVYDVLGGFPQLLSEGRLSVGEGCPPSAGSLCQVNPRTGIGVTRDGRLLLVVVDGRRPRYSIGLTMIAFARLMKRLGAVEAVNLDGGGSSTMVVRGKVVNRPSDGPRQRNVTSAALILPGPDPGEAGLG